MYLDDMKLDQQFTSKRVTITKEKMVAFATEYDPFPLHFDEEYAKKTRYGALIAPGVMSFMSIWADFMARGFLGEELIAGKSTKIEWFKPVFAGDVLSGTITVTRLERRNAYNGVVELTTHVYNQKQELVLTDVTESIVKCRHQG